MSSTARSRWSDEAALAKSALPIIETRAVQGPGWAMVAIGGELDITTSPKVGSVLDAVVDHGLDRVVVDLTDLRFIDSTGLRQLLEAARRLEDLGRLVVVAPPGTVRRVLEVSGLDRVLQVRDALPEWAASAARPLT